MSGGFGASIFEHFRRQVASERAFSSIFDVRWLRSEHFRLAGAQMGGVVNGGDCFEILFWPKTRLLGSVGAENGSTWPNKSRGVRIRAQNWPKLSNCVQKIPNISKQFGIQAPHRLRPPSARLRHWPAPPQRVIRLCFLSKAAPLLASVTFLLL